MTALSERASPTIPELRPVHVAVNPVRRGPIVLATNGSGATDAPARIADLLSVHLGLPIEVIPDRDIARFARETSPTIIVMEAAPHGRFHQSDIGARAAQVLRDTDCPVLTVPATLHELPRTIVAAVDFGASSLRAVQAALLVVGEGGRVILTHVVPPPVHPSWLKIVPDEELEMNINALFAELRADIGPAIRDGVTVETRIVTGEPVDSVLALASEIGADVVAAGTHGPGRLARVFLGGVATNLLQGAEQAVLLAPVRRRTA